MYEAAIGFVNDAGSSETFHETLVELIRMSDFASLRDERVATVLLSIPTSEKENERRTRQPSGVLRSAQR